MLSPKTVATDPRYDYRIDPTAPRIEDRTHPLCSLTHYLSAQCLLSCWSPPTKTNRAIQDSSDEHSPNSIETVNPSSPQRNKIVLTSDDLADFDSAENQGSGDAPCRGARAVRAAIALLVQLGRLFGGNLESQGELARLRFGVLQDL